MSQNLYWVWLSRRCAYSTGSFDRLLHAFSSPREIYEAGEEELKKVDGVPVGDVSRLLNKDLSDVQRIMDYCATSQVGILAYDDPRYPSRLRLLDDPPPVLYYRGKLPVLENRLAISVVGTRKMSEYGKRMTFEIAHDLARAGAIVVTGMALGNDGVASAAAVAAGKPTIAVLGSGIDIIYPREHQYLMQAITKHGVVMTEFAPGTPPDGRNFPRRNRIISGIAQGVLVTEGDQHSGALITARLAMRQGRDVYALPGKADETNSEATTWLLKNGAKPVSCADDIISAYESLYGNTLNIFTLLRPATVDADKVIRSLRVSSRSCDPRGEARVEAPKAKGPSPAPTPKRAEPPQQRKKQKENGKPAEKEIPEWLKTINGLIHEYRPEDEKPVKKKPTVSHEAQFSDDLLPDEEVRTVQYGYFESPNFVEHDPLTDVAPEDVGKLKLLDQKGYTIYTRIPRDRGISVDELCNNGEFTTAEVLSALTILRVHRCIFAMPGSLYRRLV